MSEFFLPLTLFQPVSLAETNRIARLQKRVDRKYLVRRRVFADLAAELAGDYSLLEVEGKQVMRYDTIYFDTDDLLLYRSHLQSRRLRFKVRSRRYCDSGRCFFELKYKDARGRTLKERIEYPWQSHGEIDADAKAFLTASLRTYYGIQLTSDLSRVLNVNFQRTTFVSVQGAERITCDFDLSFATGHGEETRLGDEYVIVETKSGFKLSSGDRLLRKHGQRPISCSKYCVGLGSSDPRVKNNHFRPLLRRYFSLQGQTWATNP